VTLRARWVTLRARWVTLRARGGGLDDDRAGGAAAAEDEERELLSFEIDSTQVEHVKQRCVARAGCSGGRHATALSSLVYREAPRANY
jgi:hypothetical protein